MAVLQIQVLSVRFQQIRALAQLQQAVLRIQQLHQAIVQVLPQALRPLTAHQRHPLMERQLSIPVNPKSNSPDVNRLPQNVRHVNRKYQDGSNESNVSFKSAQHIDPASAYSEVSAHEGEHVSNAYNKAREGNGEVVQASVAIHTAICPECGRTYVSGGTTTTQIKYPNESNPYQQSRKSSDAANQLLGMNFSAAV